MICVDIPTTCASTWATVAPPRIIECRNLKPSWSFAVIFFGRFWLLVCSQVRSTKFMDWWTMKLKRRMNLAQKSRKILSTNVNIICSIGDQESSTMLSISENWLREWVLTHPQTRNCWLWMLLNGIGNILHLNQQTLNRIWFFYRCPKFLMLTCLEYTPVIEHSNGHFPFPIGNSFTNGGFSMAMLDYRRVHF